MFAYIAMYLTPAISTLLLGARQPGAPQRPQIGLGLLIAAFALLIGLRYQVGTDWYNYQHTVDRLSYFTFYDTFGYKDPGFGVLTWVSTRLGLGLYGADVVCGAILMYGIWRFVRLQPDAWLSLTAAVPYLVIVVGMGYTRQAAAIGFVLVAIIHFERQSYIRFGAWMAAAAVLHGTSILILFVAAAVLVRERKALLVPLGLLTGVLFVFLLRQRVDEFYSEYIEAEYSSSGALIRLAMNAVPALIFLSRRRDFVDSSDARAFWTIMSLASLLFIALFPIFPSSTALDRLGLYFIPLQLLVFGGLPPALTKTSGGARIVTYLAALYYGAVLIVWLTFASNAHNWLPYKMIPIFAQGPADL